MAKLQDVKRFRELLWKPKDTDVNFLNIYTDDHGPILIKRYANLRSSYHPASTSVCHIKNLIMREVSTEVRAFDYSFVFMTELKC